VSDAVRGRETRQVVGCLVIDEPRFANREVRKMPYANHKGVRIHYEVDGTGPPLVLEHGLGTSLELWRLTGFAEPLKSDYQLILVDPRGHGASDKPHDPEAYRMAFRVADVVAVLDDLQIGKAHYCG
jgi:pimeloyl-ACP methyl ester carboxylesterase